MKIIIKAGNKHNHFKITCPNCDCIFLFESGDIYNYFSDDRFVLCPDCSYGVLIPDLNKYAISEEEFSCERMKNNNATN